MIGDKNHEKIALNTVLNEKNIAQEISDDDNDDDEEVDEIEDETLSFTESLKMLDKIKCSFLDEESHKLLSTVIKKLENLQLQIPPTPPSQRGKFLLWFTIAFTIIKYTRQEFDPPEE